MTTQHFPDWWKVTVSVEREGELDSRGNRGPATFHDVSECMVSTTTTEEEARRDLPDTEAYLYAPAGSDFAARDVITVPDPDNKRLWPSGRFRVNGDPGFTPLGVRVQMKRI